MPFRTSIDDGDTSTILYSGVWRQLNGSSRQWQAGVHLTSEPGASASFRFRGYQVWVWGTTPAGSGSNVVEFSIDNNTPDVRRHESNGTSVYNVLYYASPLLTDSDHTIVVTNRGSGNAGNAEFHLDRFEYEGDIDPLLSTSTTISATATATGQPSAAVTSISQGKTSTPINAILGGVIGLLSLVIGLLLFVLWKTKRKLAKEVVVGETKVQESRLFSWHRRARTIPFTTLRPEDEPANLPFSNKASFTTRPAALSDERSNFDSTSGNQGNASDALSISRQADVSASSSSQIRTPLTSGSTSSKSPPHQPADIVVERPPPYG